MLSRRYGRLPFGTRNLTRLELHTAKHPKVPQAIGRKEFRDAMQPLRDYQRELLNLADDNNVIIYLDTGTGKTRIAEELIHTKLPHIRQTNKFAVFLAPSVPLVHQQTDVLKTSGLEAISRCGNMKESRYTGEQWRDDLEKVDVVVFTPDFFMQTLQHAYIKLEQVSLLIFDEIHHMKGNYAYQLIMHHWFHPLPPHQRPAVLGLTASPENIEGLQKYTASRLVTVRDRLVTVPYGATPDPDFVYLQPDYQWLDQVKDLTYTLMNVKDMLNSLHKLVKDADIRARAADFSDELAVGGVEDEGELELRTQMHEIKHLAGQVGAVKETLEAMGPWPAFVVLVHDLLGPLVKPPEDLDSLLTEHVVDLIKIRDPFNIETEGEPVDTAEFLVLVHEVAEGEDFDFKEDSPLSEVAHKALCIAVFKVIDVCIKTLPLSSATRQSFMRELHTLLSRGVFQARSDEELFDWGKAVLETVPPEILEKQLLPEWMQPPGDKWDGSNFLVTSKVRIVLQRILEEKKRLGNWPDAATIQANIASAVKPSEDATAGTEGTGGAQGPQANGVDGSDVSDVEATGPPPQGPYMDWGSIIFWTRRVSCLAFAKLIEALPSLKGILKTDLLLGISGLQYSSVSTATTHQMQKSARKEFLRGGTNVLVATELGSEGLDFRQCSLVLVAELANKLTPFVQAGGRARARNASYVLMVDCNTTSRKNRLDVPENLKQDAQNMRQRAWEESERNRSDIERGVRLPVQVRIPDPNDALYIPGTGAMVILAGAQSMLLEICLKLPGNDSDTQLHPYFKLKTSIHNGKKAFCYTVILPANMRQRGIPPVTGKWDSDKDHAKKVACLETLRRLHAAKLLTDHLEPTESIVKVNANRKLREDDKTFVHHLHTVTLTHALPQVLKPPQTAATSPLPATLRFHLYTFRFTPCNDDDDGPYVADKRSPATAAATAAADDADAPMANDVFGGSQQPRTANGQTAHQLPFGILLNCKIPTQLPPFRVHLPNPVLWAPAGPAPSISQIGAPSIDEACPTQGPSVGDHSQPWVLGSPAPLNGALGTGTPDATQGPGLSGCPQNLGLNPILPGAGGAGTEVQGSGPVLNNGGPTRPWLAEVVSLGTVDLTPQECDVIVAAQAVYDTHLAKRPAPEVHKDAVFSDIWEKQMKVPGLRAALRACSGTDAVFLGHGYEQYLGMDIGTGSPAEAASNEAGCFEVGSGPSIMMSRWWSAVPLEVDSMTAAPSSSMLIDVPNSPLPSNQHMTAPHILYPESPSPHYHSTSSANLTASGCREGDGVLGPGVQSPDPFQPPGMKGRIAWGVYHSLAQGPKEVGYQPGLEKTEQVRRLSQIVQQHGLLLSVTSGRTFSVEYVEPDLNASSVMREPAVTYLQHQKRKQQVTRDLDPDQPLIRVSQHRSSRARANILMKPSQSQYLKSAAKIAAAEDDGDDEQEVPEEEEEGKGDVNGGDDMDSGAQVVDHGNGNSAVELGTQVNGSQASVAGPSKRTKYQHLLPQLTLLACLDLRTWSALRVLPALVYRLEEMVGAHELWERSLEPHGFLAGASPAVAVERVMGATITKSAHDGQFGHCMDHIEFIGDGILKYIMHVYLFHANRKGSKAQEGLLSYERDMRVANEVLLRLGQSDSLRLQHYVRCAFFDVKRVLRLAVLDKEEEAEQQEASDAPVVRRTVKQDHRERRELMLGGAGESGNWVVPSSRAWPNVSGKRIADCIEALLGCFINPNDPFDRLPAAIAGAARFAANITCIQEEAPQHLAAASRGHDAGPQDTWYWRLGLPEQSPDPDRHTSQAGQSASIGAIEGHTEPGLSLAAQESTMDMDMETEHASQEMSNMHMGPHPMDCDSPRHQGITQHGEAGGHGTSVQYGLGTTLHQGAFPETSTNPQIGIESGSGLNPQRDMQDRAGTSPLGATPESGSQSEASTNPHLGASPEANESSFSPVRTPPRGKGARGTWEESLSEVEEILGYTFKDRGLLREALTHVSWPQGNCCYQLLEFLGDAILGLLVSLEVYDIRSSAGDMTQEKDKFIGNEPLAATAVSVRIMPRHIRIFSSHLKREMNNYAELKLAGKCTKEMPVPKAYGDIVEALLAAVFLDSGGDLYVTRQVLRTGFKIAPTRKARMQG